MTNEHIASFEWALKQAKILNGYIEKGLIPVVGGAEGARLFKEKYETATRHLLEIQKQAQPRPGPLGRGASDTKD